jgi:diguanylate cyclase (GGDEF)-like protein
MIDNNKGSAVTKDEILALVDEVSHQVIKHFETTKTPAYPNYYNMAFIEMLKRHLGDDFDDVYEIIKKYLFDIDASLVSEDEGALFCAQNSIKAYSDSTGNIKKISQEQKEVLDLGVIEIDNDKSRINDILNSLNDTHHHLADEVHKAELKIAELEAGLEKIEFESNIDRVTNLPMVKVLHKTLDKILESGAGRKLDLFVMAIGIDECEMLIKEYGYVVGDKIHLYLSKTIDNATRIEHPLFKDSDGRFLLLLNRVEAVEAQEIANRIKARIRASKLMYMDYVINLSVSLSVVSHNVGDSVESLYVRATELLADAMQKSNNNMIIDLGV